MRRVILAALCAVMMVGCSKGLRFEIEFPTNYPDATFYLTPEDQPGNYYMKAQSDAEGVVRFKGKLSQPIVACISDGYAMISHTFFVEEGTIKFGPLTEQSKEIVAYGTPANDAHNNYVVDMNILETKYTTMPDTTGINLVEAMNRDFEELGSKVQAENMDNILGVYLFVKEGIFRATCAERDSIVSAFSPAMQAHPYLQEALKNTPECE